MDDFDVEALLEDSFNKVKPDLEKDGKRSRDDRDRERERGDKRRRDDDRDRERGERDRDRGIKKKTDCYYSSIICSYWFNLI